MSKSIALIGFMGSGKSTLARLLKKTLNWPLVSTDEYIEQKEGRKIPQIFKDSGEDHFRSLERQTILEITAGSNPQIIDCGGGIVVNPENLKLLKEKALVVYLSCDPHTINQRIHLQPRRPLLDVPNPQEKIDALLKVREPLYRQADLTVDTTDGDMNRVAAEILQKVLHD